MMQHDELFDGIDHNQSITQRYLGLSLQKFFILFLIISALGVYIGVLLYGTNSLEVLAGIEEYERYLQDEISRLKMQNASLQKEYFELKEISAK